MKLGILLQHYFPYGGLQRDAVRLAQAADQATLVCSTAEQAPGDIDLLLLNSGGTTNHSKLARFAQDCQKLDQFDRTISFSRVPDSNFHFCGDPCFLKKFQRTKPDIARLLPRYRTYLKNEADLFGPDSGTHIFFLSPAGPPEFVESYHLSEDRFTVLPPWLSKPDALSRVDIHQEFSIPEGAPIALFVGSNFAHKRLDLAIQAIAQTKAHLIVCGNDTPGKTSENIHFAGARNDIPRLMRGADFLLHPSKHETAGMVLTEALTHHLPVICTASCGYASHVEDARSLVISANPEVEEVVTAIEKILNDHSSYVEEAAEWAGDESRYRTEEIILTKMAHP